MRYRGLGVARHEVAPRPQARKDACYGDEGNKNPSDRPRQNDRICKKMDVLGLWSRNG